LPRIIQVDEPLKKGQAQPTEKQQEKQEAGVSKKSKGLKV